jgi:autotransporter-associated beta strand protein
MGADLYWNGTQDDKNGGWNNLTAWSTISSATSPNPTSAPGASDMAIFNISTVNSGQVMKMNAGGASVSGLVFRNTNTTMLNSQGSGNNIETLNLGANGITVNSGAGAVTISNNDNNANRTIDLNLVAAQSWTNNSGSLLRVLGSVKNGSNLLTVGGTGDTTIMGAIGNGTGGLNKTGTGTLTLSGANTYSGATTVSSGTLTLNYADTLGNIVAQNNSKLSDSAALNLAGGTLNLTGGSHVEVVASTAINAGASSVTRAANTAVLRQNLITRDVGGTVNYGAASIAQTDTTNVSGILGGWAVVNGAGWAVNSTNGNDGAITALASYTTTATALNVGSSYASANIDVTTSQAPNSEITPNSLRFNNATLRTLTLQGTNVINSGGILVTSTATNGGTITGGTLSGAAGADLVVHQYSAGNFTIESQIVNNTTATGLTKSGTGTLTLTGGNTYTGNTYINQGTLTLSSTGTIADSANVVVGTSVSGGVLNLTAKSSFTFGSLQTLSGHGTVNIGVGNTVTINGTHAPGHNGVGTQTVTGTLSYANSSIFSWDIAAGSADPGAATANSGSYDKVIANSITGGTSAIFNIVNGGSFSDAFWNTNKSWSDIFTGATNLASIFTSFGGSVPSNGLVANRGSFSFSGNTLNYTAIPEPTSALAGLLLTAGLLRRRRA